MHDEAKQPQSPEKEWSWLYNFDSEGVLKTQNDTVWKINLNKDKYHWAEMEKNCMEGFESNYEPNTKMDLLKVTYEIEGEEYIFIFNLNDMYGYIEGQEDQKIYIKREAFIQKK